MPRAPRRSLDKGGTHRFRAMREEIEKMAGLLDGHIAVVTGGGSGIGRAIAQGYAREGAQVAVLDANGDTAAQTAKSITEAGGKATSFVLDVTERDQCRKVAAQVAESVGRV